ncbi:MAG: glycosyltransferase family 2 protein [Lachnospiraceae bacterium]
MGYKISIVVPVYGVEQYLRRCLNSILNQTYTDIEVILVDDGSLDQSGQICEEYAALDSRIIVIHQKNQGLSAARTTGVDHATGEFIGFVDADDWCDTQMFQILYDAITVAEADMSVCGFQRAFGEEDMHPLNENPKVNVCTAESFMDLICMGTEENYMWNKLYRTEILRKQWQSFPKERFAEDMAILYRILSACHTIAICHVPCYYYFQNQAGICATKKASVYQSYLQTLSEMDAFYAMAEGRADNRPKAPIQFNRYRLFLLLRAYIELCRWQQYIHERDRQMEQEIWKHFCDAYRQIPLKNILCDPQSMKLLLVRWHLMKPLMRLMQSGK